MKAETGYDIRYKITNSSSGRSWLVVFLYCIHALTFFLCFFHFRTEIQTKNENKRKCCENILCSSGWAQESRRANVSGDEQLLETQKPGSETTSRVSLRCRDIKKSIKICKHCVTGEIHRQVVLHVWSDVHRPHRVSRFEGASVVHHGGLPCFSSIYDLAALMSDVLFAF